MLDRIVLVGSDVTEQAADAIVDAASCHRRGLEPSVELGCRTIAFRVCADHHPGYSQPIGGGIAYEGYVSPSGVGYDIGCGTRRRSPTCTAAISTRSDASSG